MPADPPDRTARTRTGDRGRPAKPRRTLGQRLALALGVSLVVVTVSLAGVLAWGAIKLNSLERVDVDLEGAASGEPQNFLIVGSDTRDLAERGPDQGAIFGDGSEDLPGGQRSDTILIARVDPEKRTAELLSIPRDLWVTIAGQGDKERINAAYNKGPQALIDTLRQTLGVPIHHYVEVNFEGFKGLVEAIDGVPMYFDRPMYDRNTGLNIRKKGCYNLNGVQALAFARSRHLVWSNGVRWVTDGTGDMGRITRQQVFLRRALAKVSTLGIGDLNTLRKLVDVGVGSVKVDSTLSVDQLISLGRRFSTFDASQLVTHRLPSVPFTTDGGASVLLLDDVAARPVLDIYRGAAPATQASTTVPPPPSGPEPAEVTVDVLNATGQQGLARKTAEALAELGFKTGTVDNTEPRERSVVLYGDGGEAAAAVVVGRLAPGTGVDAGGPSEPNRVTLVLGTDFDPASVSAPVTTTTAPTTTVATSEADKSIGVETGDPPPGVKCG